MPPQENADVEGLGDRGGRSPWLPSFACSYAVARWALKALIGVVPTFRWVCQRSTEHLDLCSGAAIPEAQSAGICCLEIDDLRESRKSVADDPRLAGPGRNRRCHRGRLLTRPKRCKTHTDRLGETRSVSRILGDSAGRLLVSAGSHPPRGLISPERGTGCGPRAGPLRVRRPIPATALRARRRQQASCRLAYRSPIRPAAVRWRARR
jgi:hypothetical protein